MYLRLGGNNARFMKKASESTIIVCSIVRNAEKGLLRNIPVMSDFLKNFKDYRVFVYENDSIDQTKNLLEKWHSSDSKHVFISLNNTDPTNTIPSAQSVPGINPFFSHKRIDKMAHIRNQYMEYIDNNGWVGDYLLVVDLDVARLDCDCILSSFSKDLEWDAVTAFGYSTSPRFRRRYHDTYALTIWGDQQNPQTESKIKDYADLYGNLKPSDEWIRVASAFGGLAIYRFEAVKGLRYSFPALENNDPRVEVRCEHFSLYKQMIERGFDRFYINPAMVLKYQDLTFKIVLNRIKRYLGK